MKIAIPTYNRPELRVYDLAKQIVGEDNVFVFFHNEEDRKKYPQNIKNAIITNTERGVARARNSILNFFKEGEEIVMMDDDITEIYKLDGNKLKLLTSEEIRKEFEKAFYICRRNNTFLWGIYPVKNSYFMKNSISNKGLIIGWIMGIIINDLRFDERFMTKEDYDYGLQNIKKYKKVIRLNYLTCNSKFKSKGGLDYVYGTEKEEEACRLLLEKWKGYVYPDKRRKNEVKLCLK